MNKFIFSFTCLFLLVLPTLQFNFFAKDEPLDPIPELDLSRYQGKWYEIARFSMIFEAFCYCATAEYGLKSDGTVSVVNTCNWGGPTKKLVSATGTAYPQDPVHGTITTGRLGVAFFTKTQAPYYVIELGENYDYALVGEPSRKYLWILSRTPTIDDSLYNRLVEKAKSLNFDVKKLEKQYQGNDCARKEAGTGYYLNW